MPIIGGMAAIGRTGLAQQKQSVPDAVAARNSLVESADESRAMAPPVPRACRRSNRQYSTLR